MKKKKKAKVKDEKIVRDKAISVRVNSQLYEVFLRSIQSLNKDSLVKTFADCVEQMMYRYLTFINEGSDFSEIPFDDMESVTYAQDNTELSEWHKQAEKEAMEERDLFWADFDKFVKQEKIIEKIYKK